MRAEHDVALALVEWPRLEVESVEIRRGAAPIARRRLCGAEQAPPETVTAERGVHPQQIDEQPPPGGVAAQTGDQTARGVARCERKFPIVVGPRVLNIERHESALDLVPQVWNVFRKCFDDFNRFHVRSRLDEVRDYLNRTASR